MVPSRFAPRAGICCYAPNICSSLPQRCGMGCSHHVWCSSRRSLTGHLNCGVDGVFETIRVVGRGLVSIAEVHAIVARAHLAQSEPEMARDRFGFLERHGFVKSSSGSTHRAADTASWANLFLSRFAPPTGFVTLRQTFVHCCHGGNCSGRASTRSNEGVFGEQIWLGVPMRGTIRMGGGAGGGPPGTTQRGLITSLRALTPDPRPMMSSRRCDPRSLKLCSASFR
jgi:hypothetical protein